MKVEIFLIIIFNFQFVLLKISRACANIDCAIGANIEPLCGYIDAVYGKYRACFARIYFNFQFSIRIVFGIKTIRRA